MLVKRLTEPAPSVRAVRLMRPMPWTVAIRKALALVAADRFVVAAELGARAGAERPHSTDGSGARRVPAGRAPRRRALPAIPATATPRWRCSDSGSCSASACRSAGARHGNEPGDAGGAKRLAVSPFDNLGAADDESFADGTTDEIRAKPAGLPGLQVTGSRSAAEYKKTDKDLATIARELGVDYLLVGRCGGRKRQRRAGVGEPEPIQVASGSTGWEQLFDANLTDALQVQADVAERVAEVLDVALVPARSRARRSWPTWNLTVDDAYLKGEGVVELVANDPATYRRAWPTTSRRSRSTRPLPSPGPAGLAYHPLTPTVSRIRTPPGPPGVGGAGPVGAAAAPTIMPGRV